MRKTLLTLISLLTIAFPLTTSSQSGDASWLENQQGLQSAIGRSWTAPVFFTEETILQELNDQGTPVSTIGMRSEPSSTPVVTDDMRTIMLSALIYEFDTDRNATEAIDVFNFEQMDQLQRDPRAPETNEFDPALGDRGYGHEGVYPAIDGDENSAELAVVYVLVQDGDLIYQLFGIFLPGGHAELATGIVQYMLETHAGSTEPSYDVNGSSTGGLWEKLNSIEVAMPDGTEVYDLQIFPVSEDAVMGDTVMVPEIDLENLAVVPGLTGSWHMAYGQHDGGTPVATPTGAESPEGVFSIELWVMEFQDPTHATAAAFSFNTTLIEPLGIIGGGGGNFGDDGLIMENTGFVRDRSLPSGDAAVVIVVEGNTLYAARVYSHGEAPTPIARDLVDHMATAEIDDTMEANDAAGTGGMWQRFPQPGDDLLYGLIPVSIEFLEPQAAPQSTPAG